MCEPFSYTADPISGRPFGSVYPVNGFDASSGYWVWMGERYVTYRADELDFEIRYV